MLRTANGQHTRAMGQKDQMEKVENLNVTHIKRTSGRTEFNIKCYTQKIQSTSSFEVWDQMIQAK